MSLPGIGFVEAPTGVATMDSENKNAAARRLFDGIAGSYERPAQVFSLFQYRRWHRALVSRLRLGPESSVLDVCTGTGLVAMEIGRSSGCRVVGVDLSQAMIEQAVHNVESSTPGARIELVAGRAESLPFADGSFDAVVFTFLLRYVEEPQVTLRELVRVLRPGGQLASLEFYVPPNPLVRALWQLYARLVLPLGTRFLSPGWSRVGSFLGPSIVDFYRKNSLQDLKRVWEQCGITGVRAEVLSLGGAVVMWGEKEAGDR